MKKYGDSLYFLTSTTDLPHEDQIFLADRYRDQLTHILNRVRVIQFYLNRSDTRSAAADNGIIRAMLEDIARRLDDAGAVDVVNIADGITAGATPIDGEGRRKAVIEYPYLFEGHVNYSHNTREYSNAVALRKLRDIFVTEMED